VAGNAITINLSGSVAVNPGNPALAATSTSTINFNTSVYTLPSSNPGIFKIVFNGPIQHPVGDVGYANTRLNLNGVLFLDCENINVTCGGGNSGLNYRFTPGNIINISDELYFWTEANQVFGPSTLTGTSSITISFFGPNPAGTALVPIDFAATPEPGSGLLLAFGLIIAVILCDIFSRLAEPNRYLKA
jgi:hypothetical protein